MMQEVNCKKAKKNGKFLLTFFSKKNHTKNHLFVQENFLLPYLFEKESVKNFDNIFSTIALMIAPLQSDLVF